MFDDTAEQISGKRAFLVVLGPIFGLFYIALLPLIMFMTLLVALPEIAQARKAAIVENAPLCMTCHSSQGLVKIFKNKEKLSVFVNASDFRGSVHRMLNCTDCHQNISMSSHPGRVFDSKKAFALDASKACRTCHTDAQLRARPIHAYLTNRTHGPPCSQCHGAHAVNRLAEWKPAKADNQYCLTCHQQNMTKTMNNGEILSLSVDPNELQASVHTDHACSDCHSAFSSSSHPVKEFQSIREHSIAVSGVCNQCHADKHRAVENSIHYTMIIEGNRNAPVCTDCHGFHDVSEKAAYDTLRGVPCRKCHENVFEAYENSVHGMARQKGQHTAPLCFSCHVAHEVRGTAMTEKLKGACLGCHTEAEQSHDAWLPNSRLHLSMVACAACHSVNSQRGIFLRLHDENTGESFTAEQIVSILGIEYEGLPERIDPHGDGIDSYELWDIVKQLNKEGADAKVTFLGRMDTRSVIEAHQLSNKKDAIRECERCHHADAEFFKTVTVAVVKADGRVMQYKADPEVLGSLTSLLSLRQFYVLGSTRLKILDWLGILMVLGGMAVPVGHITLRILTSPIREARRMNKLRKGGKR